MGSTCQTGSRYRAPSVARPGGRFPLVCACAAAWLAAGSLVGGVAAEQKSDPAGETCPSLEDTIARAAEQWPESPHYVLEDQISRSFVAGYNRVRTGGEELLADTVVVFPMLKFDTWYVLAGLDGCFVFWTELAPDLMQKLMDNGPRGPVDPSDEEF